MPPKRRIGRDDGSESDTDTERNTTVVPSPNITISEEMLQSLVSNITRSQAEANRILIENILATKDAPYTSSPRITDTRDAARRSGNFAKCTSRFDGASKNAEELEAFIDAIEVYRDCTNISDEHALRGLPMLLCGDAAVWWQGVKSSITSWSDALQRLRGMYGVPRPGYKIFRDIFSTEQNVERADVFICKVRALVSKLPYVVPEVMLLDIVYGLLDRRIRKRVSRDAVYDLEQLIAKARLVEESLAEVSNPSLVSNVCNNNVNNVTTFVNPLVAARDRSNAVPSVNPTSAVGENSKLANHSIRSSKSREVLSNSSQTSSTQNNSDVQKRIRPKCAYCKLFGHTVDNCRNKEKKDVKVNDSSSRSSDRTQLRCYGCGQLGVIRSNCGNCKLAPTPSTSDFCSAYVADSEDTRPLVEIGVINRKGVAILDTGATHSIAGPMLYDLLVKAGVVFRKTVRTIGLADGSQQVCTVLECDIDVALERRTIPTMFIVLPHAHTRTLLGRDFIVKAGILLDLPQSSWCFNDEPRLWYPFITKFNLPADRDGQMEPMKVEAAKLVPKDDEGTKLIADQRVQLNAFLVKSSDRFTKDGPPTENATQRLKIVPHKEPIASPPYRMSPSKRAMLEQDPQKLLKDPDVQKIIKDLKSPHEPFRGRSWSDRGYIMSDGIIHRYGPNDFGVETGCLVSEHERDMVRAEYHDAPTAGHCGVERTLDRLRSKYFWPGMRQSVIKYLKQCVDCQRYKADNRKPAGLLQTPATNRRFEVIAVDLFGPLPETADKNKWILIVEDTCSQWVELFALQNATSADCTKILISEIFLRYGVPRRILSDNGVQFISEVMQQVCHSFGITQSLSPVYHPQANPVERKNRDMKPQLAILVGKDHTTWDAHFPAIRFAMNSAVTSSTRYSPAYLTFGREIRAPADVIIDMRTIVESDNVVTNLTPYLKSMSTVLIEAREVHEKVQADQKRFADEGRRPAPDYTAGDLVLLKTQGSNDTTRGQTPKFIPRRDGPYRIKGVASPTTYVLGKVSSDEILGRYHVSQLTPFVGSITPAPVNEKRKRGRPKRFLD